MRLTKIAAAAAALVLSTGVLAACSGEDKDDTGASNSSSSSASADAAPAAELTKDNFATEIGKAMTAAGSVHVTLTSSGSVGLEAEGDQVVGTGDDAKLSMTMSAGGQQFEMRMLDQKLYFDMGEITKNKFAVIDLTDTDDPIVKQFGGIAEQTDLSTQFEAFGDAVTKLEQEGDPVKIDGVETTPYQLTVDAKKAAAAQGQTLPSGVGDTFAYTFYLDDDHLVRRLKSEVMGQGITMDFTDWGKDVTVEKPKDSEISDVDLSELMGGAGLG